MWLNYDSDLQKLPEDLQFMTYLKEWHIHRTKIREIPTYIEAFVDLRVLDVPKNGLTKLPVEIGAGHQNTQSYFHTLEITCKRLVFHRKADQPEGIKCEL